MYICHNMLFFYPFFLFSFSDYDMVFIYFKTYEHCAFLLGVLIDQIQIKRYLTSSVSLLQFFSSKQCSVIWSLGATMTLNSRLCRLQISTRGEHLTERVIVSVNRMEVRQLKCTGGACLLDFSDCLC